MTRTLLADSAANLADGYTSKSGAEFASVPLTIRVGDQEFTDDKDMDVNEMIRASKAHEGAARTSCASPDEWAKRFRDGGDEIIAVTITGKLSGCYNSAMLARQIVLEENPDKKIHVINSRATAGPEELIIRKADELFAEEKPFEEVVEELDKYADSIGVVFALKNYDNLIKNGRMSKIVGTVASKLNIRVVGDNSPEGDLRVLSKSRGETKAYAKMVEEMERKKDMKDAEVIISHTNNEKSAKAIAHLIEKKYPVKSIEIKENGGLNSIYAEDEGIIIGF